MNLKAMPLIAIYLAMMCLVYLVFRTYKAVFLFAGIFLMSLGMVTYFKGKNPLTRYIKSFIVDSPLISCGLILCGMTLLLFWMI